MTHEGLVALAKALCILPENTGLWRLLSDCFLRRWVPKVESHTCQVVELPPTSIVSKLLVFGLGSGSIVNRTALYPLDDMCQYHEHQDDASRQSCAEKTEAELAKLNNMVATAKLLSKRKTIVEQEQKTRAVLKLR